MMWGEKRYNNADFYYKQKFGAKVAKITVDAGFSCPNRDGTISTTGCIFCSPEGSGDFCANRELSITDQVKVMQERIRQKWDNALLLPYFQAFTNTYGPLEKLRSLYYEALALNQVVGLSIATRPDCIDEKIADLLGTIAQSAYLQVELGLQTINDGTAERINRGYRLETFYKALELLQNRNIDITVHVIIGLPGETTEDSLKTVKALSYAGIQGIKLQNLFLLQNTPMTALYNSGELTFMSADEYIETLVKMITILPPHMVIHRITGDPPHDRLIAPRWCTNKKYVLNHVQRTLKQLDLYQGIYYCESL